MDGHLGVVFWHDNEWMVCSSTSCDGSNLVNDDDVTIRTHHNDGDVNTAGEGSDVSKEEGEVKKVRFSELFWKLWKQLKYHCCCC